MVREMNVAKKKVLFHLMRPSIPCDTGDKRRSLGVLKYLKFREDLFEVDIFSANAYGHVIWTENDRNLTREFCDDLFIYEGQNSKLDFLYSRSKTLWHHQILGEILPVNSDYHTPVGYSRFFRNLLAAKQYDYVWLTMMEHAQLVNHLFSPSCISILDMQDLCCEGRQVTLATSDFAKGLKFDYETNFRKEIEVLGKFDKVVTNSTAETETISTHISQEKIALVPHPLGRSSSKAIASYPERNFIYDILFVGTHRTANVEGIEFFLNEVFPIVLEKLPDAVIALVGSVADVAQCDASIEKNVKRVGFVEDLEDAYLQSRVFVCTLLSGAGTKVKLQEAIEFSVPIVATPVGASGLSLKDEVSAFVQEDSAALAKGVITLLSEPSRAQEMSAEVLDVYHRCYSNDVINSRLNNLFDVA